MSKTFAEKLEESRDEYEIAHICFFNNGKASHEKRITAKRIKDANNPEEYWAIEDVLLNTAKGLIHIAEFDSIEMDMFLGLIYDKHVLDDKSRIGSTKPIQGIVRYYTGPVRGKLNGAPISGPEEVDTVPGRQGYIDYSFLLDSLKKSELEFLGPETFKEFEESILIGNPFKIKISAALQSKKQPTEKPATK